jgi:hypothetical protein
MDEISTCSGRHVACNLVWLPNGAAGMRATRLRRGYGAPSINGSSREADMSGNELVKSRPSSAVRLPA